MQNLAVTELRVGKHTPRWNSGQTAYYSRDKSLLPAAYLLKRMTLI